MKRKILCLFSALLFSLALSSCNTDRPDETESDTDISSEKVTETEKATETEEVTETEKATETEKVTETEKATETEEVTETEKATETEKVTETEKATETEKVTETEKATETEKEEEEEEENPPFKPTDTINVEKWLAYEIVFDSSKEYKTPVYDTDMDVVFTHTSSGETLTRPAFWNGEKEWLVRFALTEAGEWTFKTTCTDAENTGLGGISGKINCTEYTGELDIYKHGFVKAEDGGKYFTYDDGTPFFYLGDTHWTLPMESTKSFGGVKKSEATALGMKSQFHYIMDYRKAQGFTVIQSQQLATYTGATGNSWFGDSNGSIWKYGVNKAMLKKFQSLDEKFKYIADIGFVHAHSQLTYPEELIELAFNNKKFNWENAEKLVRYWIARYGAYPVMWTTTQEGDKSLYGYNGCTADGNPWLKVIDMIAKYDTYSNPTTCHQENFGSTRVNDSRFNKLESHDWFAGQMYVFNTGSTKILTSFFREYYKSPKPVVNYEGHYDHYWTGTNGVRAQAWVSYLSGVTGFGYGMQPIWSLSWAGNDRSEKTSAFGDKYTQSVKWFDGLTSDGGKHMSNIAKFFSEIEWHKLVPTFGDNEYYKGTQTYGTVATIGNEVYVGYFWGNMRRLGDLSGMADSDYTIRWFNVRTGEWKDPKTITPKNGAYKLNGKPDKEDWAFIIEKAD